MSRPTDVIVTGFTKCAELCELSFAPLRQLKREGVIRSIHYVTWDSEELDAEVAVVAAMQDVCIARVPLPKATGNAKQRGVVYQVRNLEAALACVPQDDALVIKTRPDFVFEAEFLRAKITDFDRLSRIDAGATAFGVQLRHGPFLRKIWIPWADANQPFFFEDAAFAGLKSDLAHLVTPNVADRLGVMDDLDCGPFAHVVRYASAFLTRFPIFKGYLDHYSAFANNMDYRRGLVLMLLDDAFFWHLIVANAWILHSSFHIDAGRPGDLKFYANHVNQNANWSDFCTLKVAAPYGHIDKWRTNAKAGLEVCSGVSRLYGRLMDDAWPHALFTQSMPDVPVSMLQQLAQNVAAYDSGLLRELEDTFYERLSRLYHDYWL